MGETIKSPKDFMAAVARMNGVTVGKLMGVDRSPFLVNVRAAAVKGLKDKWNLSFREIGRLFGKNHKAIINLYRKGGPPLTRIDSSDLGEFKVK